MRLSTTKLKTLRLDKGWSQEVLAKASGLSVRTIQRIEADGNASAETTLAIAAVFDLSPQALQATSTDIEVNWTRKNIVKNSIALAVISGAIGMLMWLGADAYFFLDGPSALYLILFVYASTIITFGTNGMLKSLSCLRYLFSDEMVGGQQAKYLATVYASQRKFCYGGAVIGLLIGSISIHGNIDTFENFLLHRAYAVNLIVLLYAAVLGEGLFRPLSLKLKTCDMAQPEF